MSSHAPRPLAVPIAPVALRPVEEPLPPVLLTFGIVGGATALLILAAAVAQRPVQPLAYRFLGLDFNDFWTAAGDVLAGRDPYRQTRFVTPPLSALPFLPLAVLPRSVATAVFLVANVLALAFGTVALVRTFRLGRVASFALAMTCALSPSTLMLLERGNLDGLVFAALCGFLLLGQAGLAGPICLALATGLKVYPGIFVAALAARGRLRAAGVSAAIVAASLLVAPSGSLAFLHHQLVRAGGMRLDENISALAFFWQIDESLWSSPIIGAVAHPVMTIGVLLYGVALVTCLWGDRRLSGRIGPADERLLVASYAGFCTGMPSLVYLYSGVVLLIPLAALGQQGLSLPPGRLRPMAVGIGLALVPAKSLTLTLGPGPIDALNALPPLGCLIAIAAAVQLRFDLGRGARPAA